MAWTWINPAKVGAFDGACSGFEKNNVLYLKTDETAYVNPKGNKLEYYGVFLVDLPAYSSRMLCIRANSYNMYNSNLDYLEVYYDQGNMSVKLKINNKDVATKCPLGTGMQKKLSFYIKSDAKEGVFQLYADGKEIINYKGNVLNGKELDKIIFQEMYSSSSPTSINSNSTKYYWLMLSENPIPLSVSVKVVDNPVVETDWEKNSDGTYQTSEAGKTMTVKVPDDAVDSGKALLYEAVYIEDVVGGGNVRSIVAKSDEYENEYVLTDKGQTFGFVAGEGTTFTTKE